MNALPMGFSTGNNAMKDEMNTKAKSWSDMNETHRDNQY
jgi:hypothetical protein